MRKLTIKNKKKFILSISLFLIIIISIFHFSFAEIKVKTEDYIVAAGDTLWSIALENKAENQDVREYVFQLRKINNLDGCIIYPEQTIQIIK